MLSVVNEGSACRLDSLSGEGVGERAMGFEGLGGVLGVYVYGLGGRD